MGRITAVIVSLLLAVLPGCAQASAQELIAQAPAATAESGSARTTFTMEMTGGAQDVTVSAEGVVDLEGQRTAMTLDMGEVGAQTGMGKMEMVSEGTVIYMKLDNAQQLGLPTPWLKMDLEKMDGMQGLGDLQQLNNDPSKSMEMLRGVSEDVEEVGTEEIRGETTTHYRATMDLEKAAEQAPEAEAMIRAQIKQLGTSTIPVDVWIDDQGRLRRQAFDMDLSNVEGADVEGAPQSVRMEMELFDFGTEVEIQMPPADEVTDFAELQGMGG